MLALHSARAFFKLLRRLCSNPHLIEPQPRAGDLKDREVVAGGLLVASSDGAEALQGVEEDLVLVALTIEVPSQTMLLIPLRLRVDDRLHAFRSHRRQEGVESYPVRR